jgi:hypothetical protein
VGPEVAACLLALAAGAYDPQIDTAVRPWSGLALDVSVQRLHDDFGLALGVTSPRFLDERLAVRLAGGVGWYPDLRAVPDTTAASDETFGPWSTYGHLRLTVDFAIPLAIPIGRLYAAAGPSLVVLAKNLSTTRVAPGGFGFVGIELFAGDGLQTFPVAFFFQVGGVAHAASADVERRTGTPVASETAVNRAVATGFAMEGGVRFYGWR